MADKILSIEPKPVGGGYRFIVHLEVGGEDCAADVSPTELYNYKTFHQAVLEKTGRLADIGPDGWHDTIRANLTDAPPENEEDLLGFLERRYGSNPTPRDSHNEEVRRWQNFEDDP